MKNRKLLLVVSLMLALTMSLGGTLAYLTDTDEAVNVMTLGNVKIEQLELQRAEGVAYNAGESGEGKGVKEGALVPFVQGQALYPAYPVANEKNPYTAEADDLFYWGDYVYSGTAGNGLWNDNKLKGALDKFVFVKNTGSSEAYVRTLIALECPEGMEYSEGPDKEFMMNINGSTTVYAWEPIGNITVDGTRYLVKEATYLKKLAAGNTSHPSLLQVVMTENADNEDMERLGGTYEILVLSQACQTINMPENAGQALDAAFGDVTEELAEEWFAGVYERGGRLSVWNGIVPSEMPDTLVVDGKTQTVHVKDAAAFAYLSTLSDKWAALYTDGNGRDFTNYANGAGADYYYSDRWTISLDADIDLNNHKINPVNIMFGEGTGATSFNGNAHVICNINTTTGLFADGTRVSCSNLVLENVRATNGALAGSAKESITNVTVKNATISGTDYVGGLVGKAFSSVTGCMVIDSKVTATGKEAGGLIGYIETSSSSSVTNNTVKNVSVKAGNRAAGLVAQVNLNVKVHDNTIDTVSVAADDISKYPAAQVVSNALTPANIGPNTVKETISGGSNP